MWGLTAAMGRVEDIVPVDCISGDLDGFVRFW